MQRLFRAGMMHIALVERLRVLVPVARVVAEDDLMIVVRTLHITVNAAGTVEEVAERVWEAYETIRKAKNA